MQAVDFVKDICANAIEQVYQKKVDAADLVVNPTNKEFDGDYTLITFALAGRLGGSPEVIGQSLGEKLLEEIDEVASFGVVKGFLNLKLNDIFWIDNLINSDDRIEQVTDRKKVVVEYCGPNTNKPLHLGHMRNMVVGWSVAEILKEAGHEVHKVNIYNDRGIAICKSMVAWEDYGKGETPETNGLKGDFLAGKYYVKYAEVEKKQAAEFSEKGLEPREAAKQTPIYQRAQDYLRRWEEGDEEVLALWQKLNGWVYDGLNQTFKRLGVDFERDYMESETYLLGKEVVEGGLHDGIFYKKDDGSVWVDLEDTGLDHKLLLRSDGTSVYITQDLGTADMRYDDYKMDTSVYVVGNEQDYHFKVLKEICKKLGRPFADGIYHLSYGMVDLPGGKMKSREGTVVDADEIMDEMHAVAKEKTENLGKIAGMSSDARDRLFEQIGLGALKFFLLKVHPRKRILFNPDESIELQGFTGTFVQYSHARIMSLLDKAGGADTTLTQPTELLNEERELIFNLQAYGQAVLEAAKTYDPSHIAHYVYQLAKDFNKFYDKAPVTKEEDATKRNFRILLAERTANTIRRSLHLLGIQAPERM